MKTYEEACKKLNQEPADLSNVPVELHSLIKLTTIIKAMNGNWKPDWNSSDLKYAIWWYWNGTAFVFDGYSLWCSGTCVGSRLCFKSKELAKECATTFADLWNDYLQYV